MDAPVMKQLKYLPLLILSACGGGGGSGSGGENEPPAPDIAVFFISGHTTPGDGEPSFSYLQQSAGPSVVANLRANGYTVEFDYYVDDAFQVGEFGGYLELTADMEFVRDNLQSRGTRSVVVAHSHGGVWAHSAINEVDDLTVTALVDLDTSSYGWGTLGHDSQNAFIGGDPRNRFTINELISCSNHPDAPSEQTASYDIEDVIFNNIRFALEIRSGEFAPGSNEWYDEKWNVREDGEVDGLSCLLSNTNHNEVHQANGQTIPFVNSWLVNRLSE